MKLFIIYNNDSLVSNMQVNIRKQGDNNQHLMLTAQPLPESQVRTDLFSVNETPCRDV